MDNKFIEADLTEFTNTAKRLITRDWPKATTVAFGKIAEYARNGVRAMTATRFTLHSDYVTRGIKHYPETDSQQARAAEALKRFGDMNAAVYLRGASDPKKSLEFMADHETGDDRKAQDKYIAVPTKTLRKKGFRTSKGRVRKKYKPSELLKRFNSSGSVYDGTTTISRNRQKKKRMPGNAFIIKSRTGKPFIVRSIRREKRKGSYKSTSLEFLYLFVPSVDIKEEWGFEKEVFEAATRSYASVIDKGVRAMKDYGK